MYVQIEGGVLKFNVEYWYTLYGLTKALDAGMFVNCKRLINVVKR